MSYCRWSSDRWQSDVYCYSDVIGGYTTHVARSRREGHAPEIDWRGTTEEILAQREVERAWLDATPLVPVGLPHDGMAFSDPTLADFLARLLMLREAGYHVPQTAIDRVREEIAEKEANNE